MFFDRQKLMSLRVRKLSMWNMLFVAAIPLPQNSVAWDNEHLLSHTVSENLWWFQLRSTRRLRSRCWLGLWSSEARAGLEELLPRWLPHMAVGWALQFLTGLGQGSQNLAMRTSPWSFWIVLMTWWLTSPRKAA